MLLSKIETNNVEQCDPPNTYPQARRVLGRSAPGTRRASGPVPVIADVRRRKIYSPRDTRQIAVLRSFAIEFLLTMLRYVGGIILAFMTSILLALLLTVLLLADPIRDLLQRFDLLSHIVLAAIPTLAAASGVYVAIQITPKTSKHVTPWIFTLLGALYYLYFWYTSVYARSASREDDISWPWMLPWLLLGGIAISTYASLSKKQNA